MTLMDVWNLEKIAKIVDAPTTLNVYAEATTGWCQKILAPKGIEQSMRCVRAMIRQRY